MNGHFAGRKRKDLHESSVYAQTIEKRIRSRADNGGDPTEISEKITKHFDAGKETAPIRWVPN
jgi:hypothetical protein